MGTKELARASACLMMSHSPRRRGGDGRFLGQTGWSAEGSENVEYSVGTHGSLHQTARPEFCIGKRSHRVRGENGASKVQGQQKAKKNLRRERRLFTRPASQAIHTQKHFSSIQSLSYSKINYLANFD